MALDISLRGLSGLGGIALLKRNWTQAAAGGRADAVVAMRARDRAFGVGSWAAVFVSKSETAEHMVQAIYKVLQGPFAEFRPIDGSARHAGQNARQCKVLDLRYQGPSNELIARLLTLSDNTVRHHVQNSSIFLDVGSHAKAETSARQQRLVG